MSEQSKIPSVLSAEEWASLGPSGVGHPPTPSMLGDLEGLDATDLRKAIAIANAGLPEGDPVKITWPMVDELRATTGLLAGAFGERHGASLSQLADALQSILPPRDSNG